jgi:excisionase family DNA binding protein
VADYVKIPELARRLDVSEKTARRYVQSGKLPSVFVGGAYRVSEADLTRFLEGARVEPGKAEARTTGQPEPVQEQLGLLEAKTDLLQTTVLVVNPSKFVAALREHGWSREQLEVAEDALLESRVA